MAVSFGFFADPGLVTPISSPAQLAQAPLSATGPADKAVYVGSAVANKTLKAASNPGVDQIVLSVTDSAGGTGHATTAIKLAATQGGLAAGGQSLNLGTQILSGAANAVPVWLRFTDATGTVGVSSELSLASNAVLEQ